MGDEDFEQLQQNLRFDETDLVANRSGRLSGRQQAAIRRSALGFAATFGGLGIVICVAGWRSGTPTGADRILGLLLGALIVGLAGVVLRQRFRITSVERVDARSFTFGPRRRRSNFPGVTVDGRMYEIAPGRVHRTTSLLEGRVWTFYAAVDRRASRPRIVSVEPMRG